MELIQTANQGISVKHQGIYLTWVQGSNQWLLMQKPAWLAYDLLIHKKAKLNEMVNQLQEVFDYDYNASISLINEVEKTYTMAMQQNSDQNQADLIRVSAAEVTLRSPLRFRFEVSGIRFAIEYDEPKISDYLFSSFINLKSDYKQLPDCTLRIKRSKHGFRLTNTKRQAEWFFEDLSFLKGRLHLEILNNIEDKTDNNWLSVVHGAAVSNGKNTILLVAGSGKGKSTLTALLHAHGYSYISDDMIAIDKQQTSAFSTPCAISIKPGAVQLLASYYNELESTKPLKIIGTGKDVRYIFPKTHNETQNLQTKISHIIYPEYDPKYDFEFSETDFVESLQRFNSEAWIVPENENVLAHLKWLSGTPAYRMNYSDTSKAIATCIELLDS